VAKPWLSFADGHAPSHEHGTRSGCLRNRRCTAITEPKLRKFDLSDPNKRQSPPYPKRDRRMGEQPLDEVEPVVLTRKHAEAIDGISLAGRDVGDRLPLNYHDADLLVAEGWARPVPKEQRRHSSERGKPKARKRPAPDGEALVRSVTVKLKARKRKAAKKR
jgi:hypothetical protein